MFFFWQWSLHAKSNGACEESGPSPVNAQQLQAQSQLQAQRVLGIRSDKSKGGGHGRHGGMTVAPTF